MACICQSMWLWLESRGRATNAKKHDDTYPQPIDMQEYDDASRGLNGSLLLLCKQPQSCFPASPFTIRHTDGMQGARVARDCEYNSDYYFGSFAQQTLQIPMRAIQSDLEWLDRTKPSIPGIANSRGSEYVALPYISLQFRSWLYGNTFRVGSET